MLGYKLCYSILSRNLIQDIETFSSSTILQSKNNVLFILSFYCLIKSGLVDTDGKWTADG